MHRLGALSLEHRRRDPRASRWRARLSAARTSALVLPLAVAVLVSTLSPFAAEARPLRDLDPRNWLRTETAHFVLYSNAGEAHTARIGADLEALHSVLAGLSQDGAILSPLPTKIYVFRDDESFEAFKPPGMSNDESGRSGAAGGTVAGYFHAAPLGNYVAINGDPRSRPSATIYHEYLHYFARHNLPRRIPLWLNEGLAEYYGTFQTTDSGALVGLPQERHLERLRTQPRIPFSELLAIDTSSRVYHQGPRRSTFYSQSWALVHYLLSDDQRARDLRRFLEKLALGESPDEAFRNSFDSSPMDLEIAIERYLGKLSFSHTETPLAELRTGDLRTSTIAPAEVYYQLGDLLLRVDEIALAGQFFRQALELDTGHARAHAGLGEIAERGSNWSGALIWFEDAVLLAPRDPLSRFLLGELLLKRLAETAANPNPGASQKGERQSERNRDLERARRELQKSVELGPDFPPSLAALGATYLLDRHPSAEAETGVSALERAAWLQPDRVDIVFNLASLLSRLGRFDEARRVVERVLTLFDEPETLTRARLVVVRDQLEQAARLVDGGQPVEGREIAERIAEEVLAKSSDASVRSFVLERAGEIGRIADHNEAVALYRSAVAAASRGEQDEALNLLQRITDKTRDSEILKAVRELRRQLEG